MEAPTPTGYEPDPLIGRTLAGRYRVETTLGEGGIGRVYKATHLNLSRSVALKVLLSTAAKHEGVKERFLREAKALAALHHPNVVTVVDFGVDEHPYLVMELAHGDEIEALLEAEAFAFERAVPVFRQLLGALAYAHGEGIVHRDLKPSNLFVRRLPSGDDHVSVLDFGLAKFADAEGDGSPGNPKLTQVGQIVGTPAYMSPEQVSGATCDARSDLYSATVVFYELLTGHLPFESPDVQGWLRAHLALTPRRLGEVRHDLRFTKEVEAFIERGLAKNPADRWPSAAAMLAALPSRILETRGPDLAERTTMPSLKAPRPAEASQSGAANARPNDERPVDARLSKATQALERIRQGDVPKPPKTLLVGAGVTLILLALMAAFRSEPAVESAAPPAAVAEETVEEELPPAVDSDANPWAAGVPQELRAYKAKLDRGRRLRRREIGSLRTYHRDHPDDPRPLLLHARAYVVQGWLSHALPLYIEASKLTPEAKNDPNMQQDLLRMVTTETLHDDASTAFREIYGAAGIPVVQRAIAQQREAPRRRRLQALVESLSGSDG
ncbi:MAG: serine/threonine-protein kinase [Myxococcota bacterium]